MGNCNVGTGEECSKESWKSPRIPQWLGSGHRLILLFMFNLHRVTVEKLAGNST